MENNQLAVYLGGAIERIVSSVLKGTVHNPRETLFLLKYRRDSRKALAKRLILERSGIHVPPFLISSITHSCNLTCKGCYSRANGTCCDGSTKPMLSAEEWKRIFLEAAELGTGFCLLAGGEPLLRRDVLAQAATVKNMIFPVFTNGTMIDDFYCKLFNRHRNLLPVLSMEGNEESTDERRGAGAYRNVLEKTEKLKKSNIIFGVSLTVTTENLEEVTAPGFIELLHSLGCRIIFFIEYVPVVPSSKRLAFSDTEREMLEMYQTVLRSRFQSMLFLSFPGDEKHMGGCLAAGRGFFHINPYGAAEACPFSPYSDSSLKDRTLLGVLTSPFFKRLREENLSDTNHTGGCALFEQKEKVEAILQRE